MTGGTGSEWRALPAGGLSDVTIPVEGVAEAFLVLDRDCRITHLNEQAERLLARAGERLIGRRLWAVVGGGAESAIGAELRRAAVSRVAVEGEEFCASLGAWLHVRAIPCEGGGLAVFARDGSERQRFEEELLVANERLLTMTESLSAFLESGSARAATALLVRGALRQTGSLYGFAGVVAEGPVLRILAHEGIVWDPRVNRDFYEQAIRTYEEVGYLEFRNFENLFGRVITSGEAVIANDPAGDPRAGGIPPGHPPLESFLGVPVLSARGVIGMIGVANRPGGYGEREQEKLELLARMAGVLYESCLRERREAALTEQLRHAQRIESLGRLAGGIAHDFNNSLATISGFTELALRALEREGRPERELHEVARAAEDASALTRQLLAFSRSQVMRPQPLDLNLVVTSVERMLRGLLGARVELLLRLADEPAPVKADAVQLRQVLVNLAMNARDAMQAGGRLEIETTLTSLTTPRPQGVFVIPPGEYVELTVRDGGEGMDEATRARVFEPFFTTKEHGEGTGLGLATVYGIVKQSDGYVTVESEPRRGTAFTIYLPRTAEPVLATIPARHGEEPRAAASVLLVEDDSRVRALIGELLEEAGYLVHGAADAEEALALAAVTAPDLLLTDVVLPGFGGPELAGQLRQARPRLAVLYISGFRPDRLQVAEPPAPGVGAEDFVEKPFTRDVLLAAVARVLQASRSGG